MRARAPGKIVISGAYAVLEGAPAIVAAVDRYVLADGSRTTDFVTEEVREAMIAGVLPRAPWFDASALREPDGRGGSRKLGLGSSAAILAASMGAVLGEGTVQDVGGLRDAIFPLALAAHRAAQGGGSGVDVATSVFGGILQATLRVAEGGAATSARLEVTPHALPQGTTVEVFESPVAAVTRDLIGRVRAFGREHQGLYRTHMDAARAGADAAVRAKSTAGFVEALGAQADVLTALGDAAGAGIVTPEVRGLRPVAAEEGALFMPSGAGGGDIAIFVGEAASSLRFRERAAVVGLRRLALTLGATGLSPA